MRLIHGPLSGRLGGTLLTILKVDRLRLAKRRWRGFAEDGEEFGFDLEYPLRDGTFFFHSETRSYAIEQQTEPVIDIVCPENASDSARLGWVLGNLHFPIEIHPGKLRVCDDQAIRQLLLRENYTYSLVDAVFQPLSGAHSHGL